MFMLSKQLVAWYPGTWKRLNTFLNICCYYRFSLKCLDCTVCANEEHASIICQIKDNLSSFQVPGKYLMLSLGLLSLSASSFDFSVPPFFFFFYL